MKTAVYLQAEASPSATKNGNLQRRRRAVARARPLVRDGPGPVRGQVRLRRRSAGLRQLPASTDAFVWLRLYQVEMDGVIPKSRRRPFVVDVANSGAAVDLSRSAPDVRARGRAGGRHRDAAQEPALGSRAARQSPRCARHGASAALAPWRLALARSTDIPAPIHDPVRQVEPLHFTPQRAGNRVRHRRHRNWRAAQVSNDASTGLGPPAPGPCGQRIYRAGCIDDAS